MHRRTLFLTLSLGATLLVASPAARADILPDGKTFVPVMLTLEGQDAFKDTTFVIAGCNSETGSHYVALAKPSGALRCRVKMAPIVHAVPTAETKAIEDLVAKDLGWGEEGVEVRKLLEKAPVCGRIEENALVDISAGIKEITATYRLAKTESGCSLTKVSSTNVLASDVAAQRPASSAAPASTASAAPAGSSSPAPAPKSGCATAPGPAGAAAGIWAIALGLAALARRRARS